MCGRFNVIDDPQLQKLLQDLGIDLGLPARTNIAPTEMIAAVRAYRDVNELVQLRWWLTPSWAPRVDQKYAMFNARSETIASSKAFRGPFKHRRCIVPMSSFIEWRSEEGGRQPYLISGQERALAVAGIWEHWEGEGEVIESCALLTTAAAEQFSHIHRRMPVLLEEGDFERWLDTDAVIAADDSLLDSRLKTGLKVVPIGRGVNNARHKDGALLEPIGEMELICA